MRLSQLLDGLDVVAVQGPTDPARRSAFVRTVTRDSRQTGPDAIFVAIVGKHVDGHDFVESLDCVAVVVERPVPVRPGVTRVLVRDTRCALAELAAGLHGHPARDISVVGITGTNGKTTVSTLVDVGLRAIGWKTGRIGTTGTFVNGRLHPSALTTPEAPDLQRTLATMRDLGVKAVAMEVSSIGLVQRRVHAIPFAVGVFTNLSRDHLDFHGDMDAYAAAKAELFGLLRPSGARPRALLCADDPAWTSMQPPSDHWLYGFAEGAHVRITSMKTSSSGTELALSTPVGLTTLRSPLVGRFNAQNLASALGICLQLGVELEAAVAGLQRVNGVPGRLEGVPNDRDLLVLVDYAHTPDALASVLGAVREAIDGRLWVVFGCGGDRDPGKRPEMGTVAQRLADRCVVTSDNPRSEDPQQIVDDVLRGMDSRAVHVDVDRASAIRFAIEHATPGDAVLIAGKGHETYQEIAGEKHPFDDRLVAAEVLQ